MALTFAFLVFPILQHLFGIGFVAAVWYFFIKLQFYVCRLGVEPNAKFSTFRLIYILHIRTALFRRRFLTVSCFTYSVEIGTLVQKSSMFSANHIKLYVFLNFFVKTVEIFAKIL